ncbi:MAG: ATP-binding protein, partial [Bryobacteraceae bacterium]
HDEIGQLAAAFNEMTRQLAEQRERLLQSERVAAWRELARRLAHELKNPLFPLQLTIENLQRAREQTPEQFDEIFAETMATLRAELENLKIIVGRFSDFSKMPTPQLQAVSVNEVVRNAVRIYDAQFSTLGRPPIRPELYLDEHLPLIKADPDLLHRALSNLVLNSLDAMPAGGTLTIRTAHKNGLVRVEVSDTGTGLTPEECERLFTPYYTTKRHGTGLGLAVVQSVISDHHGKISVESTPGAGATFRIELPVRPPADSNGVNRRATSKAAAVPRAGRASGLSLREALSPDHPAEPAPAPAPANDTSGERSKEAAREQRMAQLLGQDLGIIPEQSDEQNSVSETAALDEHVEEPKV